MKKLCISNKAIDNMIQQSTIQPKMMAKLHLKDWESGIIETISICARLKVVYVWIGGCDCFRFVMISYLGFVVTAELRREPHRTGIIGYAHHYGSVCNDSAEEASYPIAVTCLSLLLSCLIAGSGKEDVQISDEKVKLTTQVCIGTTVFMFDLKQRLLFCGHDGFLRQTALET